MPASVLALPDRERRHKLQFYLFPSLEYRRRILVAFALIGAGLLMQGTMQGTRLEGVLAATLPFVLFGNLLLIARGYHLRPDRARGVGEWERATRDAFRELLEHDARVRRWDETAIDLTCRLGCATLVLVGLFVFAITAAIVSAEGSRPYFGPLFAADAACLLLPHWIFGTRRGWRPQSLHEVVAALETALATIDRHEEPPRQIQPMLEMIGQGSRRVPADARVFIRFPDGPEAFLGVQFQVSLNDVQGTKYPYLYAVLIAKREFGLRTHLDEVRRLAGDLVVEAGREGDVDVLVIRQRTTKTSGYHTKKAHVRRIADAAWRAAATLTHARA